MLIPMVIDNDGRGERSYDIYSRLLKDNIIIINGEIEDSIAGSVVAQMLFLQSVDPAKTISIYLNSPGGVITSGLAIVDTMDTIKNDVSVVCMGQACSMGAVILACGTKGKRISLPSSRIMIHQPSSGMPRSTCADMEISLEETKRLRDLLYDKLAKRMDKTTKQIEKMCDRDNWMSPQQALENGIIDKVI